MGRSRLGREGTITKRMMNIQVSTYTRREAEAWGQDEEGQDSDPDDGKCKTLGNQGSTSGINTVQLDT